MKVEDSGMPDESYWNSLFNVNEIVEWLAIPKDATVIEIGCGYGTFTIPVARGENCKLVTFDIEPSMIDATRSNLSKAGLENVQCISRDVLENGTGLDSDSADVILLFNILHFSDRRELMQEAARLLRQEGFLAIIHWRKDIPTPRGPAIHVRPDFDQICEAAIGLDLHSIAGTKNLGSYHWGMKMFKRTSP